MALGLSQLGVIERAVAGGEAARWTDSRDTMALSRRDASPSPIARARVIRPYARELTPSFKG
jgi:hypothetical protein